MKMDIIFKVSGSITGHYWVDVNVNSNISNISRCFYFSLAFVLNFR